MASTTRVREYLALRAQVAAALYGSVNFHHNETGESHINRLITIADMILEINAGRSIPAGAVRELIGLREIPATKPKR